MYPFVRMAGQIAKWGKRPLDPWDTHVSHHRVMPWDLDMMVELNNGLTLCVYDMGRIPFAIRTGAMQAFRRNVALTIAGSTVRYRKRLTVWQRVEQRTRIAGWDHRFIYFDQSLWSDPETCAGQGVFRAAVVRNRKMVDIDEEVIPLLDRPDIHDNRPHLPDWMQKWSEVEKIRTWPPERL